MTTPEGLSATEVRQSRRGRVLEGLMFGGAVLVPALVVGRLGGHPGVIIPLGLIVAAIVFVAFVREKPVVVTSEEVRLPKRTIHRRDVTSVTRSDETTALVFRGVGGVVGIADLHGLSGKLREALREHGWPEVDRPA